ncbi:FecR family protein [Spirosoma koreense]
MKPRISKESLFNYFAGQATALQKQQIDEWVKVGENREFFFECLVIWETQNRQFSVDTNAALDRHRQRMAGEVSQSTAAPVRFDPQPSRSTLPTWFGWFIAATVSAVLLFTATPAKEYLLFESYQTSFGETRSLMLSDGSRVTLNANSSLRVPRFGFGEKTRKVTLTGEADFTVKHLPNHQKFVVQTDKQFEVVVLGTEFMVNTRESGQKVVLNKGKVQLRYQEGKATKQLIMKPGNLVTFDRQGRANLKQTPKPQDYTAWKENRLVFDGTTLAEVSLLFKEVYGIHLQFADESLTKWTVSGAFTATNADELIETMSSAANLTYQRKGDTLFISQEP